MRSKACIHTLTGHTNTVADVITQAANPQVRYSHMTCTPSPRLPTLRLDTVI